MANGVNAKAQEVINDYSPERRHAIDKIQEKVTRRAYCNVLYIWETPDGLEEVQKALKGTLHFLSRWENDAWFKFLLQHSDGKVRIWCKHESVAPSCIVSMIQALGGLMQQKILSSPS